MDRQFEMDHDRSTENTSQNDISSNSDDISSRIHKNILYIFNNENETKKFKAPFEGKKNERLKSSGTIAKDIFSKPGSFAYGLNFSCYDWTQIDASQFCIPEVINNGNEGEYRGLGMKMIEQDSTNTNRKLMDRKNNIGTILLKSHHIRIIPDDFNINNTKLTLVYLENCFLNTATGAGAGTANVSKSITNVLLRCASFGDIKHFLIYDNISALVAFLSANVAKRCALELNGTLNVKLV
jgi:hypothetical protein